MAATTPRHTTYADILFHALVSDQPEILQVETLTPAVQAHIADGRAAGLHLVSVRWLTGEFAYLFAEPGTDMPAPEKVIAAYHQCHWASAVNPTENLK